MADDSFDSLLDELEAGLDAVDALPDSVRDDVLRLLDGVDALHRHAMARLGALLGPDTVAALRDEPVVAWLFDAYGVGVDQHAAAERALDEIRPYVGSHGGAVELLGVEGGVVRVGLSGACAGCTASADTVREQIEDALARHVPGFVAVAAVEDLDAPAHPPPTGPVPVALSPRPGPASRSRTP